MRIRSIIRLTLERGLGCLVFPFFLAVGKIGNIRFAHLRDERIGHLVGNTDLFGRRRILNSDKTQENIILISGYPCNETIINIMKRQLPIVKNRLLSHLYKLALPFMKKTNLIKSVQMNTNEYREFSEAGSYFTFTPDEENEGKRKLIDMGLKKDDWFVSFHARDSGYLADPSNSQGMDFSYHDFRNSRIENCYKGMETVVNRGGFALRTGSLVTQPLLDNKNSHIIDYATEYGSDFLDIYINANCKFFIGNTSGLFHIPKAFGTPYAMANLIGYLHISPQPNSLFIPKLICDKKSGEFIPFENLKKLGLFDRKTGVAAYRTKFYEEHGLEPIENTDYEIAELVEDMFDLTSGLEADSESMELQRLYKDIYYNEYPDRHDAGHLAPSFIKRHQTILFP